MEAPGSRARAALLVVALGASWLAVVWLTRPALTTAPRTFDECLSVILAAALVTGWVWWTVAAGALALELAVTGGASRTGRWAPRAARVAVAALCGVGSLAAVAGPAIADPAGSHGPEPHLLSGLELPDRPLGGESPAGRGQAQVVTVRPGDTLSAIASDVDLDWHALYAVNRAVVGPDPDLIQPGQRLVVPSHTTLEGAPR